MGAESVVVVMLVLVAVSVAFASAGFVLRKGRSARRNAVGREFSLLADARAVEHLARTLLVGCGEDLALHDALAPMKRLGLGKGVLTARIAAAEARGARWAMQCGEDAGVAGRRLHLAKHALGVAEEIAERAKTMAASRTPPARAWPVPDVE